MKKFQTASGTPPVLHRNSANLMQNMLDEVKNSIQILPELQSLIPPLQETEYNQLEANIRKDGCREALLIWQTTQAILDGSTDNTPLNVLIDGHNRYAICKKNNIDFKVALREFVTLQAVRDFMIDNQLGRRNLTSEQMSYLRGLKYRNERQAAGRPVQEGATPNPDESEARMAQRTQDRLANEFKVSPRTIHRDREFSEGIDRLAPELKQEVLKGNRKVSKEVIRTIGRTITPETPPLSLSALTSFQETATLTTGTAEKSVADTHKMTGMVTEIVKKAESLNPASPLFRATCDELISLINKAKQAVE